jgi:hypothetical protein
MQQPNVMQAPNAQPPQNQPINTHQPQTTNTETVRGTQGVTRDQDDQPTTTFRILAGAVPEDQGGAVKPYSYLDLLT